MGAVVMEEVGRVVVLTIDRPSSRNAISLGVMDELLSAIREVRQLDPGVLVLRGAGERVFVSGGDLKELASIRRVADAEQMAGQMRSLLDEIAAFPFPVMAALNGHALGGGAEIALAADIRIMAEDVEMAFNQSQLGIMPAWGGVERLTQLVGSSTAMYLMLTGRRVSAEEAKLVGLVDAISPRSSFNDTWQIMAETIAANASEVSHSIKRLVWSVRPNTHPSSASRAITDFANLWVSDAHWEAVASMRKRS